LSDSSVRPTRATTVLAWARQNSERELVSSLRLRSGQALRGLFLIFSTYSGLASGAVLCRPFGAGVWWCVLCLSPCGQSLDYGAAEAAAFQNSECLIAALRRYATQNPIVEAFVGQRCPTHTSYLRSCGALQNAARTSDVPPGLVPNFFDLPRTYVRGCIMPPPSASLRGGGAGVW
jgi:hypothetical protein